jgi:hypothetical protein
MRRTLSYVLFCIGVLLVFFALAFRNPSVLGAKTWVLQTVVGFALAAFGVLLVRRQRTSGNGINRY